AAPFNARLMATVAVGVLDLLAIAAIAVILFWALVLLVWCAHYLGGLYGDWQARKDMDRQARKDSRPPAGTEDAPDQGAEPETGPGARACPRVGEIVAWRCWRLLLEVDSDGGGAVDVWLFSYYRDTRWDGPLMRADCVPTWDNES